jgi:hypothetical protein
MVAVDMVDTTTDSVVARAVAVVLPVAIVVLCGVVEDEVEDDGKSDAVSRVNEFDELSYRLVRGGSIQVFGGEHIGRSIALAGTPCRVSLKVRDGKKLDRVETQFPYIRKAVFEFNEGRGRDGQSERTEKERRYADWLLREDERCRR